MKNIIQNRMQARRFPGSARRRLIFAFAGLMLPALLLPMIFRTSAQAIGDLQITPNFAKDRPIKPDTSIELHLSRKLERDEGRIAVIIDHSDVSSLFITDGPRLVYSPALIPLPSGASEVVVYLVKTDGAWREAARFDLYVAKDEPVPASTPEFPILTEATPETADANIPGGGNTNANSLATVTNITNLASAAAAAKTATPSSTPEVPKERKFGL